MTGHSGFHELSHSQSDRTAAGAAGDHDVSASLMAEVQSYWGSPGKKGASAKPASKGDLGGTGDIIDNSIHDVFEVKDRDELKGLRRGFERVAEGLVSRSPGNAADRVQAIADMALSGEPVQVDDLVRLQKMGVSKRTLEDLTSKAASGDEIKVNDLVRYARYEREQQTQTALKDLTNKAMSGEEVRVDDLIRYRNMGLSKSTIEDLKEKAASGEPIRVNDLVAYTRNELRGNQRDALEDLTRKAISEKPIDVADLVRYTGQGLAEKTLDDLAGKALNGQPVRVNDIVRYVKEQQHAKD